MAQFISGWLLLRTESAERICVPVSLDPLSFDGVNATFKRRIHYAVVEA